jgi:hypothetical protein
MAKAGGKMFGKSGGGKTGFSSPTVGSSPMSKAMLPGGKTGAGKSKKGY